ncbi:MAG: efflux RND transporter periplasmic adaptor subunit [Anaerolineae bacterium]|nr:efflux RND transporter periplasmic adaptor subunit [Anaerolineae bacterium]
MRRVLRLTFFALVAFVVIFAGALVFQSQRQARLESRALTVTDSATVRRGDLQVAINATGAVSAEQQLPLFFEGSAMVAAIYVAEGEAVAAGQEIARLDSSDLDSTIAEAEIALELQRIAYDALTTPPREADRAVAQAAVDAARAALNAAYTSTNPNAEAIADLQSELARNRLWQAQLQRDISVNTPGFSPDISGLFPDDIDVPQEIIDQINQGIAGLIPSIPGADAADFQAGLTQAEYAVQIADASAAAAGGGPDQGGVAQANASLVAAQAALDRLDNGAEESNLRAAEIALLQAQNALEQARAARDRLALIAPFDGIVARNALRVGEPPPAQDAAVVLVDLDSLFIDLSVDETDVVELAVGQPAALSFDALPDAEIGGEVSEIAVAPLRAAGLVTYPVRVRLSRLDDAVRIGMSATATITVRALSDVLVVPNRFIRIDRTTGDAFVTVERGVGRYEEVRVSLGVRNEIESEVTAGVSEGDSLVLLPRGTFDPFN